MTDVQRQPLISHERNRWMAYAMTGVAALMLGAAFAAVPLYTLFCQATGFGGTTQRADSNPKGVIAREITTRFDANVDASLPWRVEAARPISGKIGTVETIEYTATNLSDKPVTGMAIFNVVPELAGAFFNKIECFCFTQQTLQPGETVKMPVTFFVDPDIVDNPDVKTVKELTLSYTFYASDSEGR